MAVACAPVFFFRLGGGRDPGELGSSEQQTAYYFFFKDDNIHNNPLAHNYSYAVYIRMKNEYVQSIKDIMIPICTLRHDAFPQQWTCVCDMYVCKG